MSGGGEGSIRPAAGPEPDYFICEKCPHCSGCERRTTLDWHIAKEHADLPPCTASIVDDTANETIHCAFRVGHHDEHGEYHAGPLEKCGRLRWADWAVGATPHRTPDDPASAEQEQPAATPLEEAQATVEDLRYRIRRAREALAEDEPADGYDERLRQAEIRAAVAEREAEAYRNQVQALIRSIQREHGVPEEELSEGDVVVVHHEQHLSEQQVRQIVRNEIDRATREARRLR